MDNKAFARTHINAFADQSVTFLNDFAPRVGLGLPVNGDELAVERSEPHDAKFTNSKAAQIFPDRTSYPARFNEYENRIKAKSLAMRDRNERANRLDATTGDI